MKLEIELKEPYSKDWKKGYLLTNRENRKVVILYNSRKERSSTAYARYLMAVKLGRYLTQGETVDHIDNDNDKTNDAIENLQLLSWKENRNKYNELYKQGIQHGTYAMYRTYGCRCEACCKVNSDYQKQWRQDRMEKQPELYQKHRDEYNARRRARRAEQKRLTEETKDNN